MAYDLTMTTPEVRPNVTKIRPVRVECDLISGAALLYLARVDANGDLVGGSQVEVTLTTAQLLSLVEDLVERGQAADVLPQGNLS